MDKVDYKNKVERKLQHNDTREVWRGMKNITGYKLKNSQATAGDVDKAYEFNLFYSRFDTVTRAILASPSLHSTSPASAPSPTPPSPHCSSPNTTATTPIPPGSPPFFSVDEVRMELRRLRPGKAVGPDDVCPRLLRVCADQLAEPFQRLFNLRLQVEMVPVLWKTSYLVPAPKAGCPAELNDYRPMALTSHIMKTLEWLILRHLRPQTIHALDPLQFRYQEHIGVDDTVLYVQHRAYSYVDEPGSQARIMFFDLSAFNTIQPLLLREKLGLMESNLHSHPGSLSD